MMHYIAIQRLQLRVFRVPELHLRPPLVMEVDHADTNEGVLGFEISLIVLLNELFENKGLLLQLFGLLVNSLRHRGLPVVVQLLTALRKPPLSVILDGVLARLGDGVELVEKVVRDVVIRVVLKVRLVNAVLLEVDLAPPQNL
jgi:hypothetical protein